MNPQTQSGNGVTAKGLLYVCLVVVITSTVLRRLLFLDFGYYVRENETSASPGRNYYAGGASETTPAGGPGRNGHLTMGGSSYEYHPSRMESYVMKHGRDEAWGYDTAAEGLKNVESIPSGCSLFTSQNVSSAGFRRSAEGLRSGLEAYKALEDAWVWEPPPNATTGADTDTAPETTKTMDLRDHLDADGTNRDAVCDRLEVGEGGLAGVFGDTAGDILSKMTSSDGRDISMEPLLPPLRHPEFCFSRKYIANQGYLVHDFAGLCRERIHKHSKTVFIDLGASLSFHGPKTTPPVLQLIELYERFGFVFDHIYGYEIKQQDPGVVYEAIPTKWKAAYHWFNVGVEIDATSDKNPWNLLLEGGRFGPDDFVVVKLDVDTSHIENPIAHQMLNDTRIAELVDVFYYEHHVGVKEMAKHWKSSMHGSMMDSLEFFRRMRDLGIASHYWI